MHSDFAGFESAAGCPSAIPYSYKGPFAYHPGVRYLEVDRSNSEELQLFY